MIEKWCLTKLSWYGSNLSMTKMKKLNLPHIQNQKLHEKDQKTIKLFLTLRQSLKFKSGWAGAAEEQMRQTLFLHCG